MNKTAARFHECAFFCSATRLLVPLSDVEGCGNISPAYTRTTYRRRGDSSTWRCGTRRATALCFWRGARWRRRKATRARRGICCGAATSGTPATRRCYRLGGGLRRRRASWTRRGISSKRACRCVRKRCVQLSAQCCVSPSSKVGREKRKPHRRFQYHDVCKLGFKSYPPLGEDGDTLFIPTRAPHWFPSAACSLSDTTWRRNGCACRCAKSTNRCTRRGA